MENEAKKGMNTSTMGLIAIVVIAVLAVGFFVVRSSSMKDDSMMAEPTNTMNAPADTSDSMMEMEKSYTDGTYEVVGNYTSPGGEEELGVIITLENNLIADAEVTVLATRPISNKMQTDFAENYKTMVVGKNIDEVNLGKVSGSSLTPIGFNDALEKVKAEASS